MYEPLRIAIVAEGATDMIVIEDIIANLCQDREVVFTTLQPECSQIFEQCGGPLGTGWAGVCRWIHDIREQVADALLTDNPVWSMFSAVILHLDTDVIDQTYEKGRLNHLANRYNDLPYKSASRCTNKVQCVEKCKRPSERTAALRRIICGWMGNVKPNNLVFCTPIESTDTWVLAAFFPENSLVTNGRMECIKRLDRTLENQPLDKRIRKTTSDYQLKVADTLNTLWSQVRNLSQEAERFSREFLEVVS